MEIKWNLNAEGGLPPAACAERVGACRLCKVERDIMAAFSAFVPEQEHKVLSRG